MKRITVIRDSRDGKFVPRGTEIIRPSTTEKETYKVPTRPKKPSK